MRYLVAALAGALILALCWGRYEAHRAEGWRDYAKRLEAASQAAAEAGAALRAQEYQTYQDKADAAEKQYRVALDDARRATLAHIRTNRVRPSSVSAAKPVSEAGSSAVPEGMPASAVMDATDVQTCGVLYAYSVSAYEWARSVGE